MRQHEYFIQSSPPLSEDNCKTIYRLPVVSCTCGWMGPACSTIDLAFEVGEWHCKTENTRPSTLKGWQQ